MYKNKIDPFREIVDHTLTRSTLDTNENAKEIFREN